MLRPLAFSAVVGAAAVLALACSPGGDAAPGASKATSATENLTRATEAAGISVEATWLTGSDVGGVDADLTSYPPDEFVLIEITLDTHSGDLNEIDLGREAVLTQVGVRLKPQGWISSSDDSHHRSGILVFPRRLDEGPVELTLMVGDEEMELVWEAAPGT